MKKIISILIVAFVALIIAGGSETCQRQSEEAEHTSCDVEWAWTLDGQYKPVWHCKVNVDAGM